MTLNRSSVVGSKRLLNARLISINIAKTLLKDGEAGIISASGTPTISRSMPSLFSGSGANRGRQMETDTLLDPTPYLISSPSTMLMFPLEPHI